jgi:hypothetical protein
MSLESTLIDVPPKQFPWGHVKQSGTLTPIADPNEPFDWVLYAQRDKQLAYRDVALASNVAIITVEASTVWGLNPSLFRPILPAAIELSSPNNTSADRPALIHSSGTVRHVQSSSTPFDAARVDRELFARDLLIYESLARTSSVIHASPYTGTLFSAEPASPLISVLASGTSLIPTISSAWSLAQGTLNHQTINPALPLDVNLFKQPDQNLAARDNILANYVAQVEQVLKDPFLHAVRLNVEVTLNGQGDREAETYVLAQETITRRIFKTEPALPGRLLLVYDKLLKTVQWVTEDPLGIHLPQDQPFIIGGVTVNGVVSGQRLTFVPSTLGRKDAAFWGQKARRINFSPSSISTIANYADPTAIFVSGDNIVPSFSSIAMTRAGVARFRFAGSLRIGRYRVAVLFKPQPELSIPGGQTLDSATVTSDSGVDYSSTGGTTRWGFTLPPGSWTCNVYYGNSDGTAPIEFKATVAVTGMLVRQLSLRFASDNLENGDTAIAQIPITATGTPQILSLTWTPATGDTAKLHITKLVFVSTLSTDTTMEFEASFTENNVLKDDVQKIEIAAKRYRPDVLIFNFTPNSNVTNLYLELKLLSDTDVIFNVVQIHLFRISDQDITPNAVGFEPLKSEFLLRAHESVLDSYARYLTQFPSTDFRDTSDDGSQIWTIAATDRWMAAIKFIEPRVDLAFRRSRAGDIGRLALVPEGLELVLTATGSISAGSIKANYSAALGLPVLRPLQPWMIDVGLYVTTEDFWDVEDLGFTTEEPIVATFDSTIVTFDSTLISFDWMTS